MIERLLLVLAIVAAGSTTAFAQDTLQQVQVADPFIELHSGPGSTYPIFFVIDRGETIVILRRKTDWFKVKMANQPEGWVHRSQLEKTLTAQGEQVSFLEIGESEYEQRRWELGLLGGDFAGAPSLGLTLGYMFNQSLSTEVSYTQALGDYASNTIINANLLSHWREIWHVTPFFSLGGGWLKTETRTTLVQAQDRDDFTVHAGVGLQAHVDRQFVLRLEYKNYVVFSSDDKNEDPEEWKLGFVTFFD